MCGPPAWRGAVLRRGKAGHPGEGRARGEFHPRVQVNRGCWGHSWCPGGGRGRGQSCGRLAGSATGTRGSVPRALLPSRLGVFLSLSPSVPQARGSRSQGRTAPGVPRREARVPGPALFSAPAALRPSAAHVDARASGPVGPQQPAGVRTGLRRICRAVWGSGRSHSSEVFGPRPGRVFLFA